MDRVSSRIGQLERSLAGRLAGARVAAVMGRPNGTGPNVDRSFLQMCRLQRMLDSMSARGRDCTGAVRLIQKLAGLS